MSDIIERSVHLAAPIERVWRALSDHREFGQWFRVALDQPFLAGAALTGHMTMPGYDHIRWSAQVVEVTPMTRFAYRWHPYALDPEVDYSAEPMTLVQFTLEPVDGGTRVTVVESGFDAIPAHRREEAQRMNSQGWEAQMRNIQAYVEG